MSMRLNNTTMRPENAVLLFIRSQKLKSIQKRRRSMCRMKISRWQPNQIQTRARCQHANIPSHAAVFEMRINSILPEKQQHGV